MRVYLRALGLLDDIAQQALDREAEALATRMRDGCRALPDPEPLSMFDHVYAGTDARVESQRRNVADLLAGVEA